MDKLKINLFRESWKLKKISASEKQILSWEKISIKMKKPLNEVLTDPFFYHLLNDDDIKSIDDIDGEIWDGMLNTSKNQIELWFKNKKLKKLKIDDLNEELLLFLLYKISLIKIPQKKEKGIYVIQKGVGLVGSYQTYIDNFKIDNLEFQLVNVDGLTILQNLKYDDKILDFKKSDILITYQNSYVIN